MVHNKIAYYKLLMPERQAKMCAAEEALVLTPRPNPLVPNRCIQDLDWTHIPTLVFLVRFVLTRTRNQLFGQSPILKLL